MSASISRGYDYSKEDNGYDSTNEDDVEARDAKRARLDLAEKPKHDRREKAKAHSGVFSAEAAADEGRRQRVKLLQLNAYDRHKQLVNTYQLYFPGSTAAIQRDNRNDKRDIDVIRDHHRFLWTENEAEESWEVQLAKRYYDKLFKEYCIIDLSRYKENQFGMRWRVEAEVVTGKGQFLCASKKCTERRKLRTWEVNFGYYEHGEKKNALVKCRLCFECSYKLNYHHKKKELTKKKSKKKKKRRSRSSSSSESDSETRTKKRKSSEMRKDEEKAEKEAELEQEASNLWSKPVEKEEEKSREDVFDEFLGDLFL